MLDAGASGASIFGNGAITAAFSQAFSSVASRGGASHSSLGYSDDQLQAFVDNSPQVSDVMVDVGGERAGSPNIFGHVSVAVTGGGIYSFGTDTGLGGSVSDFVSDQSQARNQTLFFIHTTPAQDAQMLGYLSSQQDNIGYFDNCAYRTYSTLRAGGVETLTPMLTPWAVQGNLSILQTPSIYVPHGGTAPDLSAFEKH